jgi:excinuclease UvrABC nuclease subunit
MKPPVRALPAAVDELPDRPAVFLLWAAEGRPYLARTARLRRRLKRLLAGSDRVSRLLSLGGVAGRIEYWLTGSQLESSLLYLELAQTHFPEDWRKIVRWKPPAFVRLVTHNPFPRTMVTTRLGRGVFLGPFTSRAAAERFESEALDLFQIRRCEQNLTPSPDHPGCIYGEMNRCLRPCQLAVSLDEYRHEAERFEQFLRTQGASLIAPAEAARDAASATMQFEEAERLHHRIARVREVASSAGDLPRTLEELAGVAVVPSSETDTVELLLFASGHWSEPRRLRLAEGAGQSLDHRLRPLLADLPRGGSPNLEHLALLARWHGSSWRDGEWIAFESLERIPYRRIGNAIGRIARGPQAHAAE